MDGTMAAVGHSTDPRTCSQFLPTGWVAPIFNYDRLGSGRTDERPISRLDFSSAYALPWHFL
jgi:hypothetical protein